MDRGAARSKKRPSKEQTKPVTPTIAPTQQLAVKSQITSQHESQAGPSKSNMHKGRKAKFGNQIREVQSKDPSLYKPKAIRTSAALIYSQERFSLPPSSELLANVRRVDLSGSDVTDVSWLEGTGVTWLSLNGCKITKGWDAVGSLEELTVLNINGCGLKSLPVELKNLSKLKAVVAMNNDWIKLDDDVIEGWKDLNSLIISHSPNLTGLPKSLNQLYHLSKLTFSHCPKITCGSGSKSGSGSGSIPDLSILPLLRDVKMNNLPLLTDLPDHLPSWGKGDLSLVKQTNNHDDISGSRSKDNDNSNKNKGDGLEVLDLGNCSLSFASISKLFNLSSTHGPKNDKTGNRVVKWDHLRSLTLHSNPLTTTHPNYVELLQQNSETTLPKLQIIDAKRVVERKRKGEIQESRIDRRIRERREQRLNKSSGSGMNNISGKKEMRKWGNNEEEQTQQENHENTTGNAVTAEKSDQSPEEKSKKSKKRKHNDQPVLSANQSTEDRLHKRKRAPSPPLSAAPTATTKDITDSRTSKTQDEPISTSNKKDRSGKTQTAVIGVIDVKNGEEVEMTSKKKKKLKAKIKRGDEVKGGIDLREVFGKKDDTSKAVEQEEKQGGGDDAWRLGVGGW
ncbi:uncharacterized protein IL334_007581 [Kwoniella shivajii]|uniref:L domain-like protein n=1 Tax=Kwoniella shivajii TaxID=564305 RepID=A0ABZ1D921_9TREE|nr:hypothetical protein IL334_007581 [Kwoniella shivajii]